MTVYLLRAFDDSGEQVLCLPFIDSIAAEYRFEREARNAKRKGYFTIILSNEFGNVREFAR